MTSVLHLRIRRLIWDAVCIMVPLLLMGCSGSILVPFEIQQGVERAEWAFIPTDESWMNFPGATLVVERRFAGVREQRSLLPNHTFMPGDNFAHLRAVPPSDGALLSLDRALMRAGGLPGPFVKDDLNVMRARDDAAGTLNWSEWTGGAGTTCVLAIRRLSISARVLPNQAIALDMVMRNCVRGDAAAALAPAAPEAVAFGAPYGANRGAKQRTLSPLAAPVP